MSQRYKQLYKPGHPNAAVNGRIGEHVYNASKVLGKVLPKGAEVHHIDGDKLNNDNGNLVVCQDRAYHKLLHVRINALKACGNANYRKCNFCKEYDKIDNLHFCAGSHSHHNSCKTAYNNRLKSRPGKTKSQLRMEAHLATMKRIAEMRKEGDSCLDNA